MRSVSQDVSAEFARLMEEAARLARESGVFGEVEAKGGGVSCRAKPQPLASFRIETHEGKLSVNWVSPDRYLSQSIEADLMWTGDDLDDLIDEELAAQGYAGPAIGRVEHFRNPEKLFTFRSAVPVDPAKPNAERDAGTLLKCLLAYEAAFRDLGDMNGPDEG